MNSALRDFGSGKQSWSRQTPCGLMTNLVARVRSLVVIHRLLDGSEAAATSVATPSQITVRVFWTFWPAACTATAHTAIIAAPKRFLNIDYLLIDFVSQRRNDPQIAQITQKHSSVILVICVICGKSTRSLPLPVLTRFNAATLSVPRRRAASRRASSRRARR